MKKGFRIISHAEKSLFSISALFKRLRCLVETSRHDGIMSAGFTLIELLVVVLIIGILAAVALPHYQLAVYKARFIRVRPWVNAIAQAQEVYYMANGRYSRNLEELDISYPPSCTYSQTSQTNNWEYDQLFCPDANISLNNTYGGISATITNCPLTKNGCVIYVVPYKVHHSIMGDAPSCTPNGTKGKSGTLGDIYDYGERVCLSLGGRAVTTPWRILYYL